MTDQTTNQSEADTSQTDATSSDADVNKTTEQVAPAIDLSSLPEGLVKDGSLDVDAIKALTELKATSEARKSDIPEDGVYKFTLDDSLVGENNEPLALDEASPVYSVFQELAKEVGLTKTEANKFASKLVAKEFEDYKATQAAVQEDIKKLGADPKARVEAVVNKIKGQIGDDADVLLSQINLNSSAVIALEKLVAKVTSHSPNPNLQKTEAQIKSNAEVFFASNP